MRSTSSILFSTILLITAQIYGQQTGSLALDHPAVIEYLIAMHHGLTKDVAARDTEDPAHTHSQYDGLRQFFGLSQTGLEHLGVVLRAAKEHLDAITLAQSQYVTKSSSADPPQELDSSILQSFYNEKLALLKTVTTNLERQLAPADWKALQSFLRSEIANTIHVQPLTTLRTRPGATER